MYPDVKFAINLDGNSKFNVQSVIENIIFRVVKYNFFFIFKELKIWAIESFYMVPCFSIQVNNKLDVEMQSVIEDHKFRVQDMH